MSDPLFNDDPSNHPEVIAVRIGQRNNKPRDAKIRAAWDQIDSLVNLLAECRAEGKLQGYEETLLACRQAIDDLAADLKLAGQLSFSVFAASSLADHKRP